jgi:hypothetical protein
LGLWPNFSPILAHFPPLFGYFFDFFTLFSFFKYIAYCKNNHED